MNEDIVVLFKGVVKNVLLFTLTNVSEIDACMP